jgi:pyruvate/2-oxoglutarate dehydrogenase complex dihydrolipoamide acyltransferase (E2) component
MLVKLKTGRRAGETVEVAHVIGTQLIEDGRAEAAAEPEAPETADLAAPETAMAAHGGKVAPGKANAGPGLQSDPVKLKKKRR